MHLRLWHVLAIFLLASALAGVLTGACLVSRMHVEAIPQPPLLPSTTLAG